RTRWSRSCAPRGRPRPSLRPEPWRARSRSPTRPPRARARGWAPLPRRSTRVPLLDVQCHRLRLVPAPHFELDLGHGLLAQLVVRLHRLVERTQRMAVDRDHEVSVLEGETMRQTPWADAVDLEAFGHPL